MTLVLGSFGDPLLQRFDLFGGQLLSRLGRWHHRGGISGRDAADDLALVRTPGDDRNLARLAFPHGLVVGVESQPGVTLLRIGAVTAQTVLRKNRANVTVKVDSISGVQKRATGQKKQGDHRAMQHGSDHPGRK